MKRHGVYGMLVALAAAVLPAGAGEASGEGTLLIQLKGPDDWSVREDASPIERGDGFWSQAQAVLSDRFELGARFMHFTLTDSSKKSYDAEGNLVGGYTPDVSIYKISEEQNYFPLPYFRWKFTPYVAAELAFYDFEAETTTIWDGHSDGNVLASGPGLQILGRYPNETLFTPFGGLGLAWLGTDFDHNSEFHANGLRNIVVDDTRAFFWTLGCSATLRKNLQADVAFSSMRADIEAEYYMTRDRGVTKTNRDDWTFVFDNWQLIVGLKYAF